MTADAAIPANRDAKARTGDLVAHHSFSPHIPPPSPYLLGVRISEGGQSYV